MLSKSEKEIGVVVKIHIPKGKKSTGEEEEEEAILSSTPSQEAASQVEQIAARMIVEMG